MDYVYTGWNVSHFRVDSVGGRSVFEQIFQWIMCNWTGIQAISFSFNKLWKKLLSFFEAFRKQNNAHTFCIKNIFNFIASWKLVEVY